MQIDQFNMCCDFAFSGLRLGVRRIIEIANDKRGTAIMAYAFLSGLVALGAFVSFGATGEAVARMYDIISTVFVASMPQSP